MTQIAGSIAPSASPTNGGKAITVQFNDNMLLPLLLGDHDRHLVRIEQALGVRLSPAAATASRSPATLARVEAAQTALQGLWRRLERGESVGGRWRMWRRRSAWSRSRPILGCRCRICRHDSHPQGRRGTAQSRPGGVCPGAGLARDGVRCGTGGLFGKTYLRGGPGGGDVAVGPGGPHRAVAARGWGRRTTGLFAGRHEGEGRSLLRPLYDALHDMMLADQVLRRMTNGEIEVAPLGVHARRYVRQRIPSRFWTRRRTPPRGK